MVKYQITGKKKRKEIFFFVLCVWCVRGFVSVWCLCTTSSHMKPVLQTKCIRFATYLSAYNFHQCARQEIPYHSLQSILSSNSPSMIGLWVKPSLFLVLFLGNNLNGCTRIFSLCEFYCDYTLFVVNSLPVSKKLLMVCWDECITTENATRWSKSICPFCCASESCL